MRPNSCSARCRWEATCACSTSEKATCQNTEVASIVTEVEVDPHDKAFTEPTKPIGKFYSEEEAANLQSERAWDMVEDSHRGWRRVVASPAPISIVQLDTIRRLVDAGVTVIACGGGGIPVMRDETGHIHHPRNADQCP